MFLYCVVFVEVPVSFAISKMKCEQNFVVGFVSQWKLQMGKGIEQKGKEKSMIPRDAVSGVVRDCIIGVYSDGDDLTRWRSVEACKQYLGYERKQKYFADIQLYLFQSHNNGIWCKLW